MPKIHIKFIPSIGWVVKTYLFIIRLAGTMAQARGLLWLMGKSLEIRKLLEAADAGDAYRACLTYISYLLRCGRHIQTSSLKKTIREDGICARV